MRASNWLLGVGVATVALVGLDRGRADARLDALATRVDSLAVSLTDVVAAIESRELPPKSDTVEIGAIGYIRGNADAPITLVEFLDYECPFCQKWHAETLPTLLKEYVETGKLRLVLRDNPLPFHENAITAARAARCVFEHGGETYWQFSEALLQSGTSLGPQRISELAQRFGLRGAQVLDCAVSDRYDAEIQADVAAAAEAGLEGTPMFIIGPSRPDGLVRGRVIRGAYPLATFRKVLDEALAAAS